MVRVESSIFDCRLAASLSVTRQPEKARDLTRRSQRQATESTEKARDLLCCAIRYALYCRGAPCTPLRKFVPTPLTPLSRFAGSPPSPLGRGCPRYEGGQAIIFMLRGARQLTDTPDCVKHLYRFPDVSTPSEPAGTTLSIPHQQNSPLFRAGDLPSRAPPSPARRPCGHLPRIPFIRLN